ncbi:MAG: DUF1294 domain-containing protein [Ahrensia sp.]
MLLIIMVVTAYMAVINLITYLIFAHDKRAARAQAPRVAENTLLSLALLGGSPAMLFAQQSLRHKTRKEPFKTTLWLIIAAQLGGAAYLLASV